MTSFTPYIILGLKGLIEPDIDRIRCLVLHTPLAWTRPRPDGRPEDKLPVVREWINQRPDRTYRIEAISRFARIILPRLVVRAAAEAGRLLM